MVSMRYRMKNSKGAVLENIMDAPAITYLHGGGYILAILESKLEGLEEGEGKTLFISQDREFEGISEEYNIEVIIDHVRKATDEELADGLNRMQMQDLRCGSSGCC